MSKAKVTYRMPSEDDSATVTMGGVRFFDGQTVDLDRDEHATLLAKLRDNPHFEVKEAAKQEDKPKVEVDPTQLKAVHVAGGRFVIKRGEEVIKTGLNKADADAFNALSDEDKATYVD